MNAPYLNDPYRSEAAKIFGVPERDVTKAQRDYAKAATAALRWGSPGSLLTLLTLRDQTVAGARNGARQNVAEGRRRP